ncbi:MAG TPA: Ku protein [Gemmatimonadaceae bacterium]|nr:Ku protein [Gemmatimonadaceae bacterium]
MATIWKGTISFGLVNIPAHLESAVRAEASISFRQLHRDDLSPIRYKRICEAEQEEVAWGEIVKGYEYAPDKFVVLEKEEIEAARPPKSKLLEIMDFAAEGDIDSRFFDTPYFILPDGHDSKAYALLREAMRETGMVGIGTITLRERQRLVSVRPVGDALVLELMRFASELVDQNGLTFPSAEHVRPQELAMAVQLVQNLAEPFAPEKYTDTYRDRLQSIIDKKLKGKKIEIEDEEEEAEGTKVVDLMARLQESLAMGKRGARGEGRGASAAKREPSAKRTTTKRATKKRARKSA